MSSAILRPSPWLNRVPRTLASSQPGPRSRAHLGVRLEPAAGEHYGLGSKFTFTGGNAHYPLAVHDQALRARRIKNLDAGLGRGLVERLHQARAAARHLDRQAAEEPALAV